MSVKKWSHVAGTDRVRGELVWSAVPNARFELEITPAGDVVEFTAKATEGVSARGLRQAPIGEMQRMLRQRVAESAPIFAKHDEPVIIGRSHGRVTAEAWPDPPDALKDAWADQRSVMARLAVDFGQARRAAATGRADVRLAGVAAVYVECLNRGEERPVVSAAAVLGVSEKSVRNDLHKARQRDLLTRVGQGKAGGELTDKARRILDGEH